MCVWGCRAWSSPRLPARLIAGSGPRALFVFIAAAQLALILFALYRMTRRKAAAPAAPYQMMPRTSMIVARVFGRAHHNDDQAAEAAADDGRREP